MNIRRAGLGDANDIRTLVVSLSHFYLRDATSDLPGWFVETLSVPEFEARLISLDYNNYVVDVSNKIVGYISIKNNAHVYHLFVSEAYQGKGLSRALWEHARRECPSELYTLRSSINAVPVYHRFGFVESSPVVEKDGIFYQPMELNLDEVMQG